MSAGGTRSPTPEAGGMIAVTGATGFLGSHICDILMQRGYRIRAAARATSDLRWLRGKPIEVATVDLADSARVRAFVTACDAVVHCAGRVSGSGEDDYQQANVVPTRTLLEAASLERAPGCFVYVSSLAAHGPAGPQAPATEDGPLQPVSAYGRSKRDAESLVHGRPWPFRVVTLRPPSLYGPRDREFLPLFKAASRGWTATLGNLQAISLVDGRDAASAAVSLMETPDTHGAYFVDDGVDEDGKEAARRRLAWGYTWDEIHYALAVVWRRRVRELTLPMPLLRAAAVVMPSRWRRSAALLSDDRLRDLGAQGWVCSAARLRRETAWRPRHDLVAGFQDTRDFFERNGWL